MTSFIEDAIFPTDISFGSSGGPGFKTNVRVYGSGYESRRVRWSYPRHAYNVGYSIRRPDQMMVVVDFFNAMDGRGYGFRYLDPLDNSTSLVYGSPPTGDDVVLIPTAVGGEQNDIQLVKRYTEGSRTINRPIKKPINDGQLIVHVNAAPVAAVIDYTTGLISLPSPLNATDVLSWGGNFHVPCRFNTDTLSVSLYGPKIGSTNIPVIEIFV